MVGQQEHENRPRSRSMLSFGSHKSSGASPQKMNKADLTESPKEKAHRRMTSKADPTMAMNELQPAMQALEKSTLESLRAIQHKDAFGNIITDPDRSNPTRPRLERPLDTIRSFEAAIEGSYNRRSSRRPESMMIDQGQSRRSSYHPGMAANTNMSMGSPSPRFPGEGGGGHGGRMAPSRPESYADPYGNGYRQSPAFNPPPPRRFGPRNHSDPALYGNNTNNGNYYNHNYQPSYDTNTTGSGASHGTEPWSNSTDPSSENSSIDKPQQPANPDLADTYGFSGFGGAPQLQGPILEEYSPRPPPHGRLGYGQSPPGGRPYHGSELPPPPPPHMSSRDAVQRPQQRGGTLQRPFRHEKADTPKRTETGEKRKSWLMRRFSKSG